MNISLCPRHYTLAVPGVIYFVQIHICQKHLCLTEMIELVMWYLIFFHSAPPLWQYSISWSISHVGKPSMTRPVSIKEEEHEMKNPS